MSLTQMILFNNHSSDPLKLFPPLNLKFPSSNTSLSDLSSAINFLSKTISTSALPSDSASRDLYFNSTVSVLDACNLISAHVERMRLVRLKLKFALHLLSDNTTNSMSKAAKLLSELDTPLCEELSGVDELQKVERAVKRLRDEIDSEGRGEKMKSLVDENETAIEELMVGLDCLARAVNGLFSVVLNSRNVVLDSFKTGSKRCK